MIVEESRLMKISQRLFTAVPENNDTTCFFFDPVSSSQCGIVPIRTSGVSAPLPPTHTEPRALPTSILSLDPLATMGNRRISPDLKNAALDMWQLGWEESDIMQALCVLRSSLYRWKKLFEELGTVTKPPSPLRGRARIITHAILTICHEIYQKQPDVYLTELAWFLAIHHDIAISISALQRNIDDAGLTRKLLHTIARERSKQQREQYWDQINDDLGGDSEALIMVDETSKNDATLARRFGRAPSGLRASFTYNFVRGDRYSVAAAMSMDGYLAVKVVPGSFDSFDFFDFIAEQVVCTFLSEV
jgi:transposase